MLSLSSVSWLLGIINSANESQGKTDAASLSNACKTYFAGIVAGQINASAPGKSTDSLPAANASNSTKVSTALNCTVKGACEYNGLTDLQNKVDDFVVDTSTGTIYYSKDGNKPAAATGTFKYGDALSVLGYTADNAKAGS